MAVGPLGLGGSKPRKGGSAAWCGAQGAGCQWPAGWQSKGPLGNMGAWGWLQGDLQLEGAASKISCRVGISSIRSPGGRAAPGAGSGRGVSVPQGSSGLVASATRS